MSVVPKTQALVIHCIDFRFQKMIEGDLASRNLTDQFDRIAWPGAAKDLANVTGAAQVSLQLHDPDVVLIYEHEDCGAYGQDNSPDTHRNNAQSLADRLKGIKPNIQVTPLIATFEGIKDL